MNFKRKNGKLAPRTEMNRKVLKFSLFSSGKYYVAEVPCAKLDERKSSTVLEHVFVDVIDNHKDAKRYSLIKCYEQKRKACYCEICWFLKETSGLFDTSKTICMRYKTKGTPHYPLETMPLNCPHFSINKELVSIEKSKYKNVKMIETAHDNK